MAAKKQTEPAKKLLNQSELATLFDLDRITVRSRLREGGIEGKPGKYRELLYDPDEVKAVLESKEDEDYERERARKTRFDADLRELELQKQRAELLPVYEVREQVQKIIQRLYQTFAIQQPKTIAARCAKAKSAAEVEKILREVASKAFADLRRDHAKMLEG